VSAYDRWLDEPYTEDERICVHCEREAAATGEAACQTCIDEFMADREACEAEYAASDEYAAEVRELEGEPNE